MRDWRLAQGSGCIFRLVSPNRFDVDRQIWDVLAPASAAGMAKGRIRKATRHRKHRYCDSLTRSWANSGLPRSKKQLQRFREQLLNGGVFLEGQQLIFSA